MDLQTAFGRFGRVVSARVMSDKRGRAKGFGYVEMEDEEAARAAVEALRGTQLNGRVMDVVLEDRKKKGNQGPPRRY